MEALPLPGGGTKCLIAGDSLSDGSLSTIQSFSHDGRAPVVGHDAAGKLNAEEEDDGAEGETNVHGSGGDVVVLHPPASVAVTNVFVEHPANRAPGEL